MLHGPGVESGTCRRTNHPTVKGGGGARVLKPWGGGGTPVEKNCPDVCVRGLKMYPFRRMP